MLFSSGVSHDEKKCGSTRRRAGGVVRRAIGGVGAAFLVNDGLTLGKRAWFAIELGAIKASVRAFGVDPRNHGYWHDMSFSLCNRGLVLA